MTFLVGIAYLEATNDMENNSCHFAFTLLKMHVVWN